MSVRIRNRRVLSATAASALAGLVLLAGCSSGSDSDSGGDSLSAADAPADFAADGDAGSSDSGGTNAAAERVTPISIQQTALIRTATIELESDDVGGVIDKIHGLVLTSGGRISSEETASDEEGDEVRAHIQLQVPVAKFDATYEELPTYGTLINRQQATEDVTAQVADVNSRVKSAEDSIDQLRLLFSRATKLGAIITLERELSQRQADLEALQAQQRSLQAQTTMSTFLVSIDTPDVVAAKHKDENQAGFVSGIKQGWDGMVTFVVGTSHAVGLVLPIAILLLVVALAVFAVVRRVTPRRDAPSQPQPSE